MAETRINTAFVTIWLRYWLDLAGNDDGPRPQPERGRAKMVPASLKIIFPHFLSRVPHLSQGHI